MQFSEILRALIRQAREELEWDAEHFPREFPFLKRLLDALDQQNDADFAQTITQLKAEVDALSWPIPTLLPTLVDMIADELAGKPTQVECPKCRGMVPVLKMDYRLAGNYTCPHCGSDVELPADRFQ